MATATFDKTFIISNPSDQKKLMTILESDAHVISDILPPYSETERKRSDSILKQFLSLCSH